MNIDRLAAWVSGVAVLIVVIIGFVLAGAPSEQRLERLDARRVADLQQLARAIDAYREERASLPDNLPEVVDGRRLAQLPTDPVSRLPYAYQALPPHAYRLCAEFDRASQADEQAQFWAHPGGQHCFELEVTNRKGSPPEGSQK